MPPRQPILYLHSVTAPGDRGIDALRGLDLTLQPGEILGVAGVEGNGQRANLTRRAEEWRWGSLYRWQRGSADDRRLLAAWPMPRPANWLEHVNTPQTDAELAALRCCVNRGSPYGSESWTGTAVRQLCLESTLRPRGRPRKTNNGS